MDFGNGLDFWKTIPMLRRSAITSTVLSKMLCPRSRMSPEWRMPSMSSFMRLKFRSSVDFPQPDGPMNAVTCFSGMSMLMSKSACFFP